MKNVITCLMALMTVIMIACSGTNPAAPKIPGVDLPVYTINVYTAQGSNWYKNEVKYTIPNANIRKIFEYGNDVYMFGSLSNTVTTVVNDGYWKNGTFYIANYGMTIHYINNVVYIYGYDVNNSTVYRIIDGVKTYNSIPNYVKYLVTVDGNDNYYIEWTNSTYNYWKNNVSNPLTISPTKAQMIVTNGNVYILSSGQYYKNGTVYTLAGNTSYASQDCFSEINGDVYIAGMNDGVNSNACYWKNTTQYLLETTVKSVAFQTYYFNDTVYNVGYYYDTNVAKYKTCYWSNNVRVDIATLDDEPVYVGAFVSIQ